MKDAIRKYLSKSNYRNQKLIIAASISILIGVIVTATRSAFIWDRIVIIAGSIFFVSLHAILPLNKMYGFIYDKRYWIALVFLIYVVMMGYSGSSIGTYAQVIQNESWQTYDTPILGKARSIRSDEWCVNMPIFISQGIEENTNPYGYYNDYLRGTTTDMFSLVSPAVADIMIISKPFMIGYLIFGPEGGLSFDWYGKLVALMLISFEFCMIITKKNKLASLCGMLLITFSAATQWWNSSNVLIFGMLALVLIDKFMLSKKYKAKLLYALGIFVAGVSYIFILYPAWQLSYGYIYLAIFIWICWKNRKEYKINWKDVLIIFLIILAIAGLCVRYVMMSKDALNTVMHTDYPGERFEIGGDAKKIVYSYVYSFLFPYTERVNNPSELAGMISFFPIPMILACIYWIRNRKNAKGSTVFLVPLLLLGVIYGVWTHMPTNEIFAKATLLYMVPPTRMAVPLGFIQILLMIYLMARIKKEDKLFGKKTGIIFTLLATTTIMYLAIQSDAEQVLTPMISYVCGIILLIGIYLLTNMNNSKYKNYLIGFLIASAIITGTTVNPIQKGISVMREKPVAKEVQKIVTQNPDNNLWLVDNCNFYIPNYILASGAKVINSTNIYPNKELFHTVLGEESQVEETRKIYNRYAHISIEMTENENKVELLYQDSIKLYISVDKVKELGVGYILTTRELEQLNTPEVQFEQIYQEQGLTIYHVQD